MGVRERIQRAVLGTIRRWIAPGTDCNLEIQWSWRRIEFRFCRLEMDFQAINSQEFMRSSAVILRRASVQSAALSLSLIDSPACALVVDGLFVDFSPRNPDDPYWKDAMADHTEREQTERLAKIDPEGAAEHSKAEKKTTDDNSNGLLVRLLLSFLLSAIRLEVHNSRISLTSREGHQGCVSGKEIVVAEGLQDSFLKGSLMGSILNAVVNYRRDMVKPCSASHLCLQLSTSSHASEENAVLLMMLWGSCKFYETLFSGVHANFPEAVTGLNSCELDILMKLIDEVQGPPLESLVESTQEVTIGCRNARELWLWGISKAMSASPSRRLTQALNAGILRRRYSSLYGDWLQKVGWRTKFRNIPRTNSLNMLSTTVSELEKQLPVEAIALARLIARKRRLNKLLEEETNVRDVPENKYDRVWHFLRRISGRSSIDLSPADMEHDARKNARTFTVDFVQGSFVFANSNTAVFIRLKKASISYRTKYSMVENAVVLGSLQSEITCLSDSQQRVQIGNECRGRWDERISERFIFFKSSALKKQGNKFKHNVHEHAAVKEQAILYWHNNFNEQPSSSNGQSRLQMPFLVAFYETGAAEEQQKGDTLVFQAGETDIYLKYVFFAQVDQLLIELMKRFNTKQQTRETSTNKTQKSMLGSYYYEQISYLRKLVLATVIEKCVQFSVVLERLRLTLHSSDNGQKSTSGVVADLGYLEFALSPSTVDSKDLLHPPSIKEQPELRGYLEKEEFRSSFVTWVEGAKLTSYEKNILEKLNLTSECSLYSEHCTTLFETSKTVSLSAIVKIPEVSVDLCIERVATAAQIILAYVNAVSDFSTHLYASTTGEVTKCETQESSRSETFALNLNMSLENIKVTMSEAERNDTAQLALASSWFHCTMGDRCSTNIFTGFRELSCTESKNRLSVDHLNLTFRGPEALESLDSKFWCSVEMDCAALSISSCSLKKVVRKAKSYPSTKENMHMLLNFDEKLSLELEGGLLVFETTATTFIINFLSRYYEVFIDKVGPMLSSNNEITVNNELDRSYSFPEGRQLALTPFRSRSTPEAILRSNEDSSGIEGSISVKISDFSLVLAAASSKNVEGILLELSGALDMVSGKGSCKIAADITRFMVIGLRAELNQRPNGKSQSHPVPQFGLNSRNQSVLPNTKPDDSASTTANEASDLNSILDSLAVSSSLSSQFTRGVHAKWSNSWRGQISLMGLDVAITTYELQMLMSILTPLSHISLPKSSGKNATSNARALESLTRDVIPDGAIVALKDAQEHLYLSVEDNTTSQEPYRLGGSWHYSIAGERALFKVKYHEKNKGKPWFSLVSLHAKDSSGVPLRVNYRPGSRQLEVTSTNDSSWESWQFIPYRNSGDDEMNLYSGIFSHLVHLINQKSKHGVSLVDGIPTVANYPGNAFKVEIVAEPAQASSGSHQEESMTSRIAVTAATAIPQVRFDFGNVCITLLHEAEGAVHLLPLVRVRLDETQGIVQVSSLKSRIIGGFSLVIEHYEAQNSSWLPIVNPVMTEIICSSREAVPSRNNRKFPSSLFCRLRKVEFVLSELTLDACLFLIGVMDLAGPFSIKHSPVLVNRCQIDNQTGLILQFRFDHEGGGQEEGRISAWKTGSYLMRHVSSRRGTAPADVSTSVAINLIKPGTGLSSAINISLGEPGVFAVRTRIEAFEGSRVNAPGPIVVLDVSRQSQEGILLTVSPMVKIHNATGLVLQLRCRRPKQGEGGAVVTLKDGDIVDDSMGAFDALSLEGEMKKALLSFNVGNFLLSIRPEQKEDEGSAYEWSEDVKGAKAVRASGLFDKLNYSFKKTLKSKSLESSFGSVFCKQTSVEQKPGSGLHFLIRTLRRQVPITKISTDQQQKRSVLAWQEQQELLLLPTLRMFNFLSATVRVQIKSQAGAKNVSGNEDTDGVTVPERGGKVHLYSDLTALFLVIKVDEHSLTSHAVDVSTGHKQFQELTKKGGSLKDLDIEVTFKDSMHVANLKVYRADDGVLELIIFTKYMLRNVSQVPFLCCAAKPPSRWQGRRVQNLQWPPSAHTVNLSPETAVSWFPKSSQLLIKRQEDGSQPTWLDLDSLSGSSELILSTRTEYSVEKIQLGVTVHVPSRADSEPSHVVALAARYTVVNDSAKPIFVCQDGLEEHENHYVSVEPGGNTAVHAQELEGINENKKEDDSSESSSLSLRFRLKEQGWRWSGRICAASLGSFFLKLRRDADDALQFAVIHVEEELSALIIRFRLRSKEPVSYRIENRLQAGSITFHQKDATEPETLQSNTSMDYVWDDLSLPHKLVVTVSGSQARSEINPDKVKGWKSFAASHRSKGFSLQLPFQGQFKTADDDRDQSDDLLDVGYEVYADGPTRVLRVCQKVDSTKKNYWESEMSIPQCKLEFKIPTLKILMLEASKQRIEDLTGDELSSSSPFTTFLCGILSSSTIEIFVTSENAICQLRVQSLGADIKWQGAPFAAMLRIHDQDHLNITTTALHAAFVLSSFVANPIQVKYASLLLQAFDLNLDEDTLMKLVPLYRVSLSTSTTSLQLYFERFEIHPIKIVASFVPGNPRADYTSAQETFRALLHTVIKLPSVRGATVELNGVLLSHALLTFKQLLMKCVQHYSWYTMRAIYIARGSKLLPPGFSSLFDDSAASSLDVFFDPSSGSIDVQGLTLGMFNLLSRGLRKKRGQGGTSRYLGDLEKTVKRAGSNLVFAVVTEISDNVLKGAETNGFDGMINGFRRGVLNVAMEPLVLQKAVIRGGSTRRIQLDRSAGTDEAYIEGYVQAMLDALFKQDYLKVKVMEDQVILKNLPPNSMLMNEIVASVKNFLISEGLLAGEVSIAAVRSMRLLGGEQERKIVPAVISLSEQLLVIFAIRGLRQYTKKIFHIQIPGSRTRGLLGSSSSSGTSASGDKEDTAAKPANEVSKPSFKRTIGNFFISSAIAYIDGRLCRNIPNELARRIVSGFLLSFVE